MTSCLFCDFVSGKRKTHTNGLPFEPIAEDEDTLTFLSIDFPFRKVSHLLVIPKEHYASIADMPEELHSALASAVQKGVKVIKSFHGGCNFYVNDEKCAGQEIFHVHYHIIPRDPDDDIGILVWDRSPVPVEDFEALTEQMKKQYEII